MKPLLLTEQVVKILSNKELSKLEKKWIFQHLNTTKKNSKKDKQNYLEELVLLK
jgi:hypothetical protein